ncbi:hypothetical protein [Anaeromyxobacter diazotrophicus]|uniref:Uncharacterized protein n=1 Tax=Anaeromyxobacter diazotrophicus TaxID=2590199 RepID=A0A7I9VJ03_9BACT|nr:hypothetical protein [Anaeromyxobacter diazotrophicus]GEJ56128.1 hypothetical protein AMYX_08690 [Anaeromyxobacter diazotrophicus]
MTLLEAAQVGEVLSGVGTAAAVLVAAFGIRGWKRDRRRERRSEAAATGIVALTTACDALAGWTGAIAMKAHYLEGVGTGTGMIIERMADVMKQGRSATEEPLQQLRAAAALAVAYLTDEEAKTLRSALAIAPDVEKEHHEFMMNIVSIANPSLKHVAVFFDEFTDSIGRLRDEGVAALRPVARFDVD